MKSLVDAAMIIVVKPIFDINIYVKIKHVWIIIVTILIAGKNKIDIKLYFTIVNKYKTPANCAIDVDGSCALYKNNERRTASRY